MSAFSRSCNSTALFCCARIASRSRSRCLMSSDDGFAGEGVPVCAITDDETADEKPASRQAEITSMEAGDCPNRTSWDRERKPWISPNSGDRRSFARTLLIRSRRRVQPSALTAVIRMAGQDGRGPVDLLQQHDAYHLMRPSGSTERNAQS